MKYTINSEDNEHFFLYQGNWLHESLMDFIFSYKEERNYGND